MKKCMTMQQPARRWQDGLPCGNGVIGALVYGHIKHELILVNHEKLWLRTPRPELPDVSGRLPELREFLAAGRYEQAKSVLSGALREQGYAREHVDPYHPAFDIVIDLETRALFRNYSRSLNLETGEAEVRWEEDGITVRRTTFVSCTDDLIAVRISSDDSQPVVASIKLAKHETAQWDDNWFEKGTGPDDIPITFKSGDQDLLSIIGTYADGNQFGGAARVCTGDDTVVLVKVFANEPAGPALERIRKELDQIDPDYDSLLARHAAVHGEIFNRMRISLSGMEGERPREPLVAEELLQQAFNGDVSAELVQLMSDYGRYLLITSSRPGSWPANLQGIWNGNYVPAWWADFHNDENIQMNYWQALQGNMPETTLPFFDYYEEFLDDWRENAQKIYGMRGVLAPISQSTHGLAFPGVWVNWTAGAGWLAQLFYDYWLYTRDREFLKKRAIPFMKEVALFYEDFLFEGEDGKYVFAPSLSPENSPDIDKKSIVCLNAAMDVAVAKEVLSNLCVGCEELGIEADSVAKWRGMIGKLPDYMINEDGALKEWLHPDLNDNYHHRHQSHIYPVFPGFEFSPEDTPELFEAARVAVEKRLVVGIESQTGWSLSHMACIYARLGEGNRALECLELLLRGCTGPNLFTYHNDWRGQGLSWFWGHSDHTPFQIDANFGFTAAVQEMILQSRPGFVALLPALPDAWTEGSVEGMLARGGIEVSVAWKNDRIEARFLSARDQSVTVRTGSGSVIRYEDVALKKDKPLDLVTEGI